MPDIKKIQGKVPYATCIIILMMAEFGLRKKWFTAEIIAYIYNRYIRSVSLATLLFSQVDKFTRTDKHGKFVNWF